MKIKDITINEMGSRGSVPANAAPTAGTGLAGAAPTAGTGLAGAVPKGQGSQKTDAPKKVPATSDPAVLARQQELIAAGAKIKADGIMGKNTRDAEKQFGPAVDAAKGSQTAGTATTITNPAQAAQATDRFAGQAKTDAQTGQNNLGVATAQAPASTTAVDPSVGAGQNLGAMAAKEKDAKSLADFQKLSGMTPTGQAARQEPAAQPEPAAPNAELDRLKQLAISSTPAGTAPAPGGQAAQQEPAATQQEPAAVSLPANIGSMNPTDAARELRAAQAAAGKPVLEPGAQVVGTGTGGSVTTGSGGMLTTRSPEQIEWENRPENKYGNKPYPGAAAVAQQDAEKKARGDQTAASVKGFLNKINPFAKKEPAPVAGQGAQAAPSGAAAAMSTMRESDDALLATIRNIR